MVATVRMWVSLGLIAGVLGRWVMPGPDPFGVLGTIVVGIGGAGIAGLLLRAIHPAAAMRAEQVVMPIGPPPAAARCRCVRRRAGHDGSTASRTWPIVAVEVPSCKTC